MHGTAVSFDVGTLYALHGGWLHDWLHARTRCPQWAADLTQDTFCRLIERGGEAPADARNYLATVARRLLIDQVRRRDVERAYLDSSMLLAETADVITPERIAEAVELLQGIVQLLDAMPAQTRTAYLMRRLDGLSHGEIAAALGISERTVKRRIAEAYACCYAHAYPD